MGNFAKILSAFGQFEIQHTEGTPKRCTYTVGKCSFTCVFLVHRTKKKYSDNNRKNLWQMQYKTSAMVPIF